MKSSIILKKIGPIEEVSIELNRINIFMGPQSSGKSTIAKIISFCQWLEKESLVQQDLAFIDVDFIQESFLEFHNISHYFGKESYLSYKSNVIELILSDFSNKNLSINVVKGPGFDEAKMSKNAYIPADRNLIFIPNFRSLELADNYLRSFLLDWDRIRSKFGKGNSISLVDTDEKYCFVDDSDTLIMKDGKELPMDEASSGIQSVTPLYLFMSYLTQWIYSHREDKSLEALKRIKKGAIIKWLKDDAKFDATSNIFKEEDLVLDQFENVPTLQKILEKYQASLSTPCFSNIVIEEPEQNLFPQTQAQLVYDIIRMLNKDRDSLVITTHSPFILYAINNCVLAYLNALEVQEKGLQLDFTSESFINPDIISIWEIRKGYLENYAHEKNRTIQDDMGLVRSNYFDRVMANIMADYNNLM